MHPDVRGPVARDAGIVLIDEARLARSVRLLSPLLRRSLRRHLAGRMIDPADAARGRFLRQGANRVADSMLRQADRLLAQARIDDLPTAGSRLNVGFTVLTVSLYRALLEQNVPRHHAVDLTADVVWHYYALGGRAVHRLAGLRTRDPHERMVTALRMLLRFPFGAPGRPAYEVETADNGDSFITTWTWCPPHAFVRQLIAEEADAGELEAFRRSWCSFDWAFNDLIAGGNGGYRRPHTMSDGDAFCDMTWQAVTIDPPPPSSSDPRTTRETRVR